MRVSAIQFKARPDREAGLAALTDEVLRVGSASDLVVCPEMALAGYAWTSVEAVREVAETAEGPTARALSEAAARAGCWVVSGFPERDGERVFNSALVIDPSGTVQFVYRKTLLFEADAPWATPGDSGYRAFDTGKGRFGVGICMDLNDDRFLDWAAREAIDVLALPTNWVSEDGVVWEYWRMRLLMGWPAEWGVPHGMPERARVNAVLVAANSYGTEGAYVLSGKSAILSADTLFAATTPSGDATITAVLEP